MSVRVVSARESSAVDAEAIETGIPSRALMRVASANAATIIAQRCGDRLRRGVTIYTGAGNNGGDGWCVARALARAGIPVTVVEVVSAKTPDAIAEREAAEDAVMIRGAGGQGTVVIDALLGTGASGTLRGPMAAAVEEIHTRRERGDFVVALDIPTGLDATTGKHENGVVADLTITFGACKRGLLVNRAVCGEIVVVDIGLDGAGVGEGPVLIDAAWVDGRLPDIPPDAHKGMRKRLTIVGGGSGMGGAAVLATMAALKSGIGMVRVVAHERNLLPLQARVPQALTLAFPVTDAQFEDIATWGDGLLIGPGLGRDNEAAILVEQLLARFQGPIVLDADALNIFAGDVSRLAALLGGKPVVITPHPTEFARLVKSDVSTVLEGRYDVGVDVAKALRATVLLKGTPTVITSHEGARVVSATGTPALATGGSGDVLSGIVATLLTQGCAPHIAAGCAAWIHGRAAELCAGVRGVTLDDVLEQLPSVWEQTSTSYRSIRSNTSTNTSTNAFANAPETSSSSTAMALPRPAYPVLAQLPNLS